MDANELTTHAEWLEGKLREARDGIGETNVVIPDGDGGVTSNPAMDAYVRLAKEYRLTVKQLHDMGLDKKPCKVSALAGLKASARGKAV